MKEGTSNEANEKSRQRSEAWMARCNEKAKNNGGGNVQCMESDDVKGGR